MYAQCVFTDHNESWLLLVFLDLTAVLLRRIEFLTFHLVPFLPRQVNPSPIRHQSLHGQRCFQCLWTPRGSNSCQSSLNSVYLFDAEITKGKITLEILQCIFI